MGPTNSKLVKVFVWVCAKRNTFIGNANVGTGDQINNSFGNDEDPFNKIIPQKTEEDKDFNQFKEENEIIKFSPK